MKKLIQKLMAFFLSLSLVLGTFTFPSVVVQANTYETEDISFQDYPDSPLTSKESALNGLSAQDIKGYDFTMYSNSDKEDSSLGISTMLVAGQPSKHLTASINGTTGGQVNMLVVSRNDKSSFDLYSVTAAFSDTIAEANIVTLTGYDKAGNSVASIDTVARSVYQEDGLFGNYANFYIVDDGTFNGIYSYSISVNDNTETNVGLHIQGFTAKRNQDSTGGSEESDLHTLKSTIENFSDDPSAGDFYAEVSEENNTVTVTGSVVLAKRTLELNIPQGVRVIWKARFSINIAHVTDSFHLNGKGTFELAEESELYTGMMYGEESELTDFCAIKTGDNFPEVIISGGQISMSSGNAIRTTGHQTKVIVIGGTLRTYKGTTIYTSESDTQVMVSGGFVDSSDGVTIQSGGEVLIDGGTVRAMRGSAVVSNGNVVVSGRGQVLSYGGFGIRILTHEATATISSGVVFSYIADGEVNMSPVVTNKEPITDGNGAIVMWDRSKKINKYTAGTLDDISDYLNHATVKWAKNGGTSGIEVSNGTDTYFLMMNEATVIDSVTTVSSITIYTPPAKAIYQSGEPLDLTGLVVSLNKSDDTSEKVPFANFAQKGISTNPVNGITLTNETSVTITYAANNKSTNQKLKVMPGVKNHTVTFETGGLDPEKRMLTSGTSIGSVNWPSDPVKTGYLFGGWYLGENGSCDTFTSATVVNADITVYAKWTAVTNNPVDITVSSVSIKSAPTKTIYTVGDALDLSGLIVTLLKSDNSSEDISFEQFNDKGITTIPANGTSLITEASVVIITYAKDNQSINQCLTINPASNGNNNSGSNSGNNQGNNNAGSNQGTTPSNTEQITVDVKQGNTNSVASQIIIERTTNENGSKSDKVTYQKERAAETVQKLKAEGKETARIVIPDEKEEVAQTDVNIPVASLETLAEGKINLQIDTEKAKISLPKESVQTASQLLKDDLYFRLVPVKDEAEKETVSNQARLNAVKISGNSKATASIIGNPITIETNLPSTKTDITLPLTGVVIPTARAEKQEFLKQLAVYIEHSDGDKELVQGTLVEYSEGVYGLRFQINKFSTFTVVKTNAFNSSSVNEISGITAPSNAVIKGSSITASVANQVNSLTVKATVSKGASWKLYLDKTLKKEILNKKLALTTGNNISYLKVTAQDGTFRVYQLTITRAKSYKANVTKVTLPEKAVIKGNTVSATVANKQAVITVKAQVSSKAAYKIYSDKALKKEIKNFKVSLKEGKNIIYLKVTAESGTTKVYTLNITRKAENYKSHVNLGLIGSKEYAYSVSKIFSKDYDSANVTVKEKGNYYLVTMDFKNKEAATIACDDMIRRKYIINYYFH